MNKTHSATFVGAVKKKRYEYGNMDSIISLSSFDPKIIKEVFEEEYEVIQSDQFCNPPMKQGDKVELYTIDKIVLIKEVIRDSDGGYIYHTNHVIKEIEDEETEKTKLNAEKEKLEDELENLKKEIKELERIKNNDEFLKDYKESMNLINKYDKKWYQFWK